MELFNNKENEILKFKINSDGININSVEPRLILMTKENKTVLLIGKIENDVCKFEIPQLTVFEKGDHGKIKFEIISEDLYFSVWSDTFEIKTKATIKIEEMITEIQQSSKPKPSISVAEPKIEVKPIVEQKKVETKNTVSETFSKLEEIFEKKVSIVEESDDDTIVENLTDEKNQPSTNVTTEHEEPSIIRFDFFK